MKNENGVILIDNPHATLNNTLYLLDTVSTSFNRNIFGLLNCATVQQNITVVGLTLRPE